MKRMGPAARRKVWHVAALGLSSVVHAIAAGLLSAWHVELGLIFACSAGALLAGAWLIADRALDEDEVLRQEFQQAARSLVDKETFGGFRRHE